MVQLVVTRVFLLLLSRHLFAGFLSSLGHHKVKGGGKETEGDGELPRIWSILNGGAVSSRKKKAATPATYSTERAFDWRRV